MPTHATTEAVLRAWSKIDSWTTPSGCWPYLGARSVAGYGQIRVGSRQDGTRRKEQVSRVILAHTLGRPIRPGHVAAHRCDNPPCCRPSHLFEALHIENVADMVVKGRNYRGGAPTGERNGHASLTARTVMEIRRLAARGAYQRDLARQFGIRTSTVCRIVHRQAWKHLP